MTSEPVIPLGNGQILLRGPAVVECYRLLTRAVALSQQRDGIAPSPRLRALLSAFEAEAANASACPSADVRDEATSTDSIQDAMFSDEVAAVLGLSDRQVRRIATRLGGKRIGGRWTFNRVNVAEIAAERGAA